MTRILWGDELSKQYNTGIDRGVLYVDDSPGVPWDGLVSISNQSTGGDATPYYIDGIKYLNLSGVEEAAFTLSAFYSPIEFDVCDGALEIAPGFSSLQNVRKPFGLTYRTMVGNALEGYEAGYKLHFIYNGLAAPATRNYTTIGRDVPIEPLSWSVTTTPVIALDGAVSAEFVIDSTRVDSTGLSRLEDILYGTELNEPRLPTPEEIRSILMDISIIVVDNGDGSFTVSGPDNAVYMTDDGVFEINSHTAFLRPFGTFFVSST